MSEVDAIHFVGQAAPVPLLMQFANFEPYFRQDFDAALYRRS
jgi:hypothetical protein